MKYARINLAKTNYALMSPFEYSIVKDPDLDQFEEIYHRYCVYKKFKSVMPIFPEEYTDPNNDLIAYYDNSQVVAFSLIRRYNQHNAEAVQFAWDYENPDLEIGFRSLRNECALYKARGFHYLYLGGADEYKRQFDGFETLGPRT